VISQQIGERRVSSQRFERPRQVWLGSRHWEIHAQVDDANVEQSLSTMLRCAKLAA
jgi:hypothetical protein